MSAIEAPTRLAMIIFDDLRDEAIPERAPDLSIAIEEHLDALEKQAEKDSSVAIAAARSIVSGLRQLLLRLDRYGAQHQSFILGAAAYFASENDQIPDHEGADGLQDDVAIFNHVVQMIGRRDLTIRP